MSDSSKDLQLRELKDMINDLKKMIKTLQATVDAANKREEALMQERDNLKAEIDLLRKKLFGSSSEKTPADFPGQLNLFHLKSENSGQRMRNVSKVFLLQGNIWISRKKKKSAPYAIRH